MSVRIGINGFGRIGRGILRAAMTDPLFSSFSIVAINDLTDTKTLAHLLKYDSVMGRFPFDVQAGKSNLIIDGNAVQVTAARDPSRINWLEAGVDYVIEATGRFREADLAREHIVAGAGKVVITAPAKGEDLTVVMGVNEEEYNPAAHHIVSNASCTTNCLAPVVKILHERFGVLSGIITTVHAYTNDQRVLDFPHSDLRRARAAAVNMIPTKTGAAAAVGKVIPELAGKLDGLSVRVPIPNVSLVDFVVHVEKHTTVSEINDTFKASQGRILAYTEEPLVSTDFLKDPHSSIIDGLCTRVMEGNLVKVMAWYDNEWGYSNRVLDLILYMEEARG